MFIDKNKNIYRFCKFMNQRKQQNNANNNNNVSGKVVHSNRYGLSVVRTFIWEPIEYFFELSRQLHALANGLHAHWIQRLTPQLKHKPERFCVLKIQLHMASLIQNRCKRIRTTFLSLTIRLEKYLIPMSSNCTANRFLINGKCKTWKHVWPFCGFQEKKKY